MRFVTIATSSYRQQSERLLRSLRRVHPDATVELHVDDAPSFDCLAHLADVIELEDIGELGVKRAKFVMYRRAGARGPFVYLDGDIVVLARLDAILAGDGLAGCPDDLTGCPFIPDRTHPWPGDPTLPATRYVNSGVLGFGPAILDRLESWERRARDDTFWRAHIHPDGLFDNHVLCALLELDEIDVHRLDATTFNWQGYRSAEGRLVAEVRDGRLVHAATGRPLHLVHFAGIRDIDDHLLRGPFDVASVIDAASLEPAVPARAMGALRAAVANNIVTATPEVLSVARVMAQAMVDVVDPELPGTAFVGDPTSVVSAALSIRPSEVRWNGLNSGGAYLEASEYVMLRDLCRRLEPQTIVELGAGETTQLFTLLGSAPAPRTISLEPTAGPWFDRAIAAGTDARLVPFTPGVGMDEVALDRALADVGSIDLLFVDSPVGTASRALVLGQLMQRTRPRHIALHDARRDALALVAELPADEYRVSHVETSLRGLLVLSHLDAAPLRAFDEPRAVTDVHAAGVEVLGPLTEHGGRCTVPVRFLNVSDGVWPVDGEATVRLSYHLRQGSTEVLFDGARTSLPCRVDIGDSIDVELRIDTCGLAAGRYTVDIVPVHEGVAWFDVSGDRTSATLEIRA